MTVVFTSDVFPGVRVQTLLTDFFSEEYIGSLDFHDYNWLSEALEEYHNAVVGAVTHGVSMVELNTSSIKEALDLFEAARFLEKKIGRSIS